MKQDQQITPAEWRIMRIVWTLGSGTSHEITDLLQQQVDWKAATIKTLLRRLVDKGALTTKKQGRAFVYHPLMKEQPTMCDAADRLFDQFCAHCVGHTINHVIERADLSKSDIKQLQAILAEKAQTAPETVECDCIPGAPGKCNCQEAQL